MPENLGDLVLGHRSFEAAVNFQQLITFGVRVFVSLDQFILVLLDDQVPVFADPFLGDFFNANVLVLFSVQKNLFAAFLVFEAEFVETLSAFAAVGFDGGPGGVVRQRVGRLGIAVINRADDNRTVRIAIEKFHDDLLADPRQKESNPNLCRPRIGRP